MATYTNFCVRNGGSNLNSGTLLGDLTEPLTTASFTYASGSWVNATSVFTVASGDPAAEGIVAGMIFAIYADGATIWAALFRCTVRDATTITGTLIAGTSPTDGSNNRTVKFGGAWEFAATAPWNLLAGTTTNVAADPPRINIKSDIPTGITANITFAQAGHVSIEGYASTYGDGGVTTWQGVSSGASFILATITGSEFHIANVIFTVNGATANAIGFSVTGARCRATNITVHDVRGVGISTTDSKSSFENCLAYACNQSGTANQGGFTATAGVFTRCISRDNVAANSVGFYNNATTNAQLISCIAKGNATSGLKLGASSVGIYASKCDFYGNTGDGIDLGVTGTTTMVTIENSNFLKNGGYAVGLSGTHTRARIRMRNCGFGVGAEVNTSGNIQATLLQVTEIGAFNYPSGVHPYNDPTANDFRIKRAEAIGTGYGTFATGSATVSYPDVGACESSAPTIPATVDVRGGTAYGYALNQQTGLMSGSNSTRRRRTKMITQILPFTASLTAVLATTEAIPVRNFTGGSYEIPTASSITSVTFYGSHNGTDYQILREDTAGTATQDCTRVVAAEKRYFLPSVVFEVPWIKMVSDATGDITVIGVS